MEKSKEKSGFLPAVEKKRRNVINDGKPSCSVVVEVNDASYEENVLLLKVEFNELEMDIPKMLRLNRETFQRRRKWINSDTTIKFDQILLEFPHFLDLRFVSFIS